MKRIGTAILAAGITLAIAGTATAQVEKVYVCHAAGQAGTDKFVTVYVPVNDGGFPNGHYTEDGTQLAGHEDDYLGRCVTEETTTTTEGPSSTTIADTTTTTGPATTTTTATTLPTPSTVPPTTTTVIQPTTTTTTTRVVQTVPPRETPPTFSVDDPCGFVTTDGPIRFQTGDIDANLEAGTYDFSDLVVAGDEWAIWTAFAGLNTEDTLLASGVFEVCDAGREFTPPVELPFTGASDWPLFILAAALILGGLTLIRLPQDV